MQGTIPLARGRYLALDHPLVMGILNVTPDSFSDGGRLRSTEAVIAAARAMVDAGAAILDVGGESTRPGAVPVGAHEEARRVVPAIAAIRRALPESVISVDTRKAEVAAAALEAGADLVNDVSGLADPAMADVVLRHGCAVVLMRNQPCAPPIEGQALDVGAVVEAARSQLAELLLAARQAGIADDAIILDPGLGFGDPPGGDPAANLALLRSSGALSHGHPVLVGASRKRFIGRLTGIEEPARRVAGSVAAAVLAAESGASIVRVHDVAETVQALRVAAVGPVQPWAGRTAGDRAP